MPPNGFTITALPIKIKDSSGGPVRVVAEIDPDDDCGPVKVISASTALARDAAISITPALLLLLRTCYVFF